MHSAPCFAELPIKVVTTIGQISDVVRVIGGSRVQVHGLMGPGVDPHLYKATERDVRKLSEADIIFYNGLHLEAKLAEILEKMSRFKTTIPVGDAIPAHMLLDSPTYPGQYDPHIWFDVKFWIRVTTEIRDQLTAFDPAGKADYYNNAQGYLAKLEILHTYVDKRSKELPDAQRVLVTAHDAFRYFGRKYNFEVVGLQGISTESQAGLKDIMSLAEFIAEREIRAIFVESSVPVRNVKAVQEAVQALGWEVKIGGELFSDALGALNTEEGTYIGMVTHNIDTIVNALLNPDKIHERTY
jgi:manganese/zinc/iron transport system substrate-binding protein